MDFDTNSPYSREDVWKKYNLYSGRMPKGGNWFTGYTVEGSDLLAFLNIGTAGKTGHDFANSYDEKSKQVIWFGKTASHSKQNTFKKLLTGDLKLHLFARWNTKDVKFIYLGVGQVVDYQDHYPVEGNKTAIRFTLSLENSLGYKINCPTIGPEGILDLENQTTPQYANKVFVLVNKYERDPKKRRLCLEHFGARCKICGFSFTEKYGDIGEDFCHIHHIEPLSESGGEHDIDPLLDLIPVCANCHAMLHIKSPALKPDELRLILSRSAERIKQ